VPAEAYALRAEPAGMLPRVPIDTGSAWPPCAGPAARSTTRSWRTSGRTHHENVHFYGTHCVDIDGELAQLDTDGYRPLRLAEPASVSI
jgi:hypothetical protein